MRKEITSGFTLVETLVAISVLLIAITGPFYAIQKSITAAYVARDQLIATALSQEAVEYVYALRDGNYLQNQQNGGTYNWLDGINGQPNAAGDYADCLTSDNPNGCTLDPTQSQALAACASNGCLPMTLDPSAVRYTQVTTNPATKFTRTIKIPAITTGKEATIQVTVTWKTLGTPYSVVTTEELYNWQ